MTNHRCDAHAHVTEGVDFVDEVMPIVQCELFLGHEGDHRVMLVWPDPVAAAQDAEWSAERLDPDETFDVEVPIEKGPAGGVTPRACSARWDPQLGEPFDCSRAVGHDGPHHRLSTEEDDTRSMYVEVPGDHRVCGHHHPDGKHRCAWASGHYGYHTNGLGTLWA